MEKDYGTKVLEQVISDFETMSVEEYKKQYDALPANTLSINEASLIVGDVRVPTEEVMEMFNPSKMSKEDLLSFESYMSHKGTCRILVDYWENPCDECDSMSENCEEKCIDPRHEKENICTCGLDKIIEGIKDLISNK